MVGLTKEEFIQCLNFIYTQDEKQNNFINALETLTDNQEYCTCLCYAAYEAEYIKLIKKLMKDKHDDIEYFLYEMERGELIYENAPYTNEEELYDYLVKESEVDD